MEQEGATPRGVHTQNSNINIFLFSSLILCVLFSPSKRAYAPPKGGIRLSFTDEGCGLVF